MLALRGKALAQLHAHDAKEKAKGEQVVLRQRRVEAKAQAAAERAARKEERVARRAARVLHLTSQDEDTFRSLIDSSAGPQACHPWLGRKKKTTSPGSVDGDHGYLRGEFFLDGYPETDITSRLITMLTIGIKYIDRSVWLHPECGDHLCCNVDHYSVIVTGSGPGSKTRRTPVRTFFAEAVANDAKHDELERMADQLLGKAA